MAYNEESSNNNAYDFQVPESGFGSYVRGILPDPEAVLAGAFGVSMQQIKNIQNVDLERFAQVVYSLETNEGLPLTNGTNVPSDKFLVDQALSKIALGSDIYGTYNMSNFFGCMSGLPYPLVDINNGIKQLETTALYNIYDNLYLAVKWEQASATFDGTTFTFTNRGGGYGRESGPPVVTVGGNPATAVIGTDSNNLNTFGKIISINYSGSSGTVLIGSPPGPGWPGMNAVIQNYIDQANNEISAIQNANTQNFQKAKTLNTNYNILGTMLKIEQRARFIGRAPTPIPFYDNVIPYPQSLYTFVDYLPSLAQQTGPNGPVQNLESVADFCDTGGQSLIGMLRQERNQARLNLVGLTLDNNIPAQVDAEISKTKLVNGTVAEAVDGVIANDGQIYTIPAWSINNNCDNSLIDPIPIAYYDPEINDLRLVDDVQPGNINSILNDINPIVSTNVPRGLGIPMIGVLGVPANTIPENGIRTVGLFPVVNVLPPNLDRAYISSTILPSSYNVQNAINKVIECNCDCWIN
jgi:hypothetical protein